MTIRTRVTAALLTLITMALLETAIVIVQYRAVRDAFEEESRTAAILLGVEQVRRALGLMQSAQRGYAVAADTQERAVFDAQALEFQQRADAIHSRLIDATQRERFATIIAQSRQWRDVALGIMTEVSSGRAATEHITAEAASLFRALDGDLSAFERERVARSEAAARAFRDRLRAATLTLTVVPLSAIFVLMAVLLVTDRRILVPLKGLAAASRRLASGDYQMQLPDQRPDEVGALIGAFRHMRNAIEERAAAAAAANDQLHIAHHELLATIDLVPSAIIIMNSDGSVRLQNRAAKAVIGEPPVDASARKSYWQRFAIRDATGRPVRIRDIAPVRALAGVETIAEELELQRPDGTRVVILLGAVPLHDAHGRIAGVVSAFQDITRRRELDRLKDEFVSIVSHELRTPLAAIRGSLQLVIHDRTGDIPGEPGDETGELLAVALKSCDRLVRIVNDMLDLSKIEAGKIDLKLAPVAPAAAIGLAVDGVHSLAAAAEVAIVREIAADIPDVLADADRLTQALINLISNAIKFSPRGDSVTVSAHRAERGMVRFSVADRGPGIAAADVVKLFQRFQQLDSTATRKAGGTGLGLAITKGIVAEHGGEISVASDAGAGSTFSFTIPMVGARPEPATRSTALPRETGQPTILVVEDDADARVVLRQTLERRGFSVIEAADGREAIDAATREAPDLVVLDLQLPTVHGREVIRALRKHNTTAAVPIVVVSGDTAERQTLESLVLGANVFVTKPADSDGLAADIHRLLRRTAPNTP